MRRGMVRAGCAAAICAGAYACSRPDRTFSTTNATYDKKTGKLTELTYDRNHNGRIDTWTEMDGPRPLRSRIDLDEDGTIDRWEYYDSSGRLLKVGFSRHTAGKPDAWAFAGADGAASRIEVSSTADEKKIDRREIYQGGAMVATEEDPDGDGAIDKWETYEQGALKTAAFDENKDGRPDRRLTYQGGELVLIETNPDASGTYTTRIAVK